MPLTPPQQAEVDSLRARRAQLLQETASLMIDRARTGLGALYQRILFEKQPAVTSALTDSQVRAVQTRLRQITAETIAEIQATAARSTLAWDDLASVPARDLVGAEPALRTLMAWGYENPALDPEQCINRALWEGDPRIAETLVAVRNTDKRITETLEAASAGEREAAAVPVRAAARARWLAGSDPDGNGPLVGTLP